MAVWNDIRDILASIDSKLGDNSAKRAGILGDVLPKKKEKSEDAKLQSLENTIQKAFSKIPILNQLLPVIQGFRDTLRDLLAMRGLFVGLGDIGKGASSLGGLKGIFNKQVGSLVVNKGMRPLSIPQFGKALKGGNVGDTIKDMLTGPRGFAWQMKKGFRDGSNRWMETFAKRFKNFDKLSGVGGVAGAGMNLGKATQKLLAPLVANAGVIAAGLAGIIASIVAAVVVATVAVVAFAKHLVFAKRHLAKLNAQYAIAFATHDIRKIFRDMRSAARTSATTQKFLNVWNDFLDKMQPVFDELFNIFVRLATVVLRVVNQIIDVVPAAWNIAATAANPLIGPGMNPWDVISPWPSVIDWMWGEGNNASDEAARDAHDGKIMSLMEKANRAMDLIIKAHEEDLDAAVPVSAAAFMAGVAGVGYESNTVRDMNLRPDLDVIWKRHAELK